jgi:hypothetical protein
VATVKGTPVIAKPQKIAFAVGAFNFGAAVLHILPLSPVQHWAQLVTGVVGLLLAGREDRARLFGLLLIVCYGGMLAWDLAAVRQFDVFLPVRMIVSGIVIEVVTGGEAPRR